MVAVLLRARTIRPRLHAGQPQDHGGSRRLGRTCEEQFSPIKRMQWYWLRTLKIGFDFLKEFNEEAPPVPIEIFQVGKLTYVKVLL